MDYSRRAEEEGINRWKARFRFFERYWEEACSRDPGPRRTSRCKKESLIEVLITQIILPIIRRWNSTTSKSIQEAMINNMFSGIIIID